MTIYILSRGYPDPITPQWGCFERDQAEALAALGHTIVLLYVEFRFRWRIRKRGFEKRTINGVNILSLFTLPTGFLKPLGGTLLRKIKIWHFISLYNRAVKLFGKPDVLYSHYLTNTDFAVELKQRFHIPLVGIEHWSKLNQNPLDYAIEQQAKHAYPHLDRLITVSHHLQHNIKQLLGIDSIVVYNMVNSSFLFETKPKQDDVIRFISVGSLLPIKGFDTLLKAFFEAKLPSKKWTLSIVGDGCEYQKICKLIDDMHLNNNVQLLGKRTKDQISRLLCEHDVFCLASRSETFGVAIIEALSCGLPVIATQCGGPEEFITKDNGLLVPIGDVAKLSDAIKYIYEHYQQYNRKAIANSCQSQFSSKVIAEQLTEIFEDVINHS